MSSFKGENMQTQYNVLGYRIDIYFQKNKLEIEIDENGDSDRNIDYEIKRQKEMEQELGREFITIDADKKSFFRKIFFLTIFRNINEIFRHMKQLTKKSLTNKISAIFLELEFKAYYIVKSKAMEYIVKRYCLIVILTILHIRSNENVLLQLQKRYCY